MQIINLQFSPTVEEASFASISTFISTFLYSM